MPITADPNDPRLTHGPDDVPVAQAPVYLVLSDDERAKGYPSSSRDAVLMRRHRCPRDEPCPACERGAEQRVDARRDFDPEPLDRHGVDADYHYPRGYGGLT